MLKSFKDLDIGCIVIITVAHDVSLYECVDELKNIKK
jgi:hypothetical protein